MVPTSDESQHESAAEESQHESTSEESQHESTDVNMKSTESQHEREDESISGKLFSIGFLFEPYHFKPNFE